MGCDIRPDAHPAQTGGSRAHVYAKGAARGWLGTGHTAVSREEGWVDGSM